MNRTALASTLAVAAVTSWLAVDAAPAHAEGLQIEPGKWEVESTSRNSMMPQPRVRKQTECITETEWNTDRFMQDTQGCTVSELASSASKLEWKIACDQGGGKMTGNAVYESSGDAIDGKMSMAMQAQGRSMTMDVTWKGRRVGACD